MTLVRSVYHRMNNHNSAGYYSPDRLAPLMDDQRLRDSRESVPGPRQHRDRLAPRRRDADFVSLSARHRRWLDHAGPARQLPGQQHRVLHPQDPNSANFRLPELSLPDNLTTLENRREMMDLIDRAPSGFL